MKLLITGATGLVGTELVKQCLAKNYTVYYLTTNKSKLVSKANYKGFYWNPINGEIDVNSLNAIDAVINLAGAPISKRWTKSYKKDILESRIQSVRLLYRLLSENKHTVKQFCSASALGIYPSSLTEKYDETETEISSSFLGNVVKAWEDEVDKLSQLGISVSKLRIGIVFSKNGGALQQMIKPIKLGFGAAIGNGNQWQSWIHIKDLSKLFLHVVKNKLEGTYNAVANEPITNKELTNLLAKNLHKTIFLPNVPTFVIKLLLGEMADLVLESQYLKNDKVKNTGFNFKFENITNALASVITSKAE